MNERRRRKEPLILGEITKDLPQSICFPLIPPPPSPTSVRVRHLISATPSTHVHFSLATTTVVFRAATWIAGDGAISDRGMRSNPPPFTFCLLRCLSSASALLLIRLSGHRLSIAFCLLRSDVGCFFLIRSSNHFPPLPSTAKDPKPSNQFPYGCCDFFSLPFAFDELCDPFVIRVFDLQIQPLLLCKGE
ncbi:unnamed protein product [Lactuca virosa]|uniref:Uncharacterized protein n=1 Tax=Lactuca virosa TaxID=75947 RepID=A0AAU9NFJ4_9ASTR|nr:unnamed protein product [Lactuca virosa]